MSAQPAPGASLGTDPVAEGTLLDRLRAGEASAFETLVRTYGPRLRSVTGRLLKNPDDADDAVQEAFLSALKSLDRFQGRASVTTWLHRIAVNAALMKLRSRGSSPEESIEPLLPEFAPSGQYAEHQVAFEEPAYEPALRGEEAAYVREMIDRLPENFRIALLLRDIEGLGNEELAGALGVSVNAAKIRVHRARQALRTLLEPHFAKHR